MYQFTVHANVPSDALDESFHQPISSCLKAELFLADMLLWDSGTKKTLVRAVCSVVTAPHCKRSYSVQNLLWILLSQHILTAMMMTAVSAEQPRYSGSLFSIKGYNKFSPQQC